jgi:hypothetical protein
MPTKLLRDENIAFAFALFGGYASDYFNRYYDNSDPDPRIELQL